MSSIILFLKVHLLVLCRSSSRGRKWTDVSQLVFYPCSTELLAHPSLVGSKIYFFWSPTEDYCVTVWWNWFVFVDYQVSVWSVGSDLMRRKCPDDRTKCRSDTGLIVDKHKSDSSDCDTIVFRRWPEEINLGSDEWKMSQKLCGTGVLLIQLFLILPLGAPLQCDRVWYTNCEIFNVVHLRRLNVSECIYNLEVLSSL